MFITFSANPIVERTKIAKNEQWRIEEEMKKEI